MYPFEQGSIQELIAITLEISPHLTDRTKRDIRLAYAKYEAYLDANKAMSKLITSGAWTHKVSNDDIIEVFFSKSAYFKDHAKVFSLVHKYPDMQKWLRNEDDALNDTELWKYKKKTFANLKEILVNYEVSQQKKSNHAASEKTSHSVSQKTSHSAPDRKGKGRKMSQDSDEEQGHHRKKANSSRKQQYS